MYSGSFLSNTGDMYSFGKNTDTVWDINMGDGLAVDISTSQGFNQIGESVNDLSVSGKNLTIKGDIFRNVDENRKHLRSVFAPFINGRITFDNGYCIDVYVKETPTFSPVKGDGRFTMQLYAPFPFFVEEKPASASYGKLVPTFHFPINYKKKHKFGTRFLAFDKIISNNGDVPAFFNVTFETAKKASNITVTDIDTGKFLRINTTIREGDKIVIERDNTGVLTATYTSGSFSEDVTAYVDPSSTLEKFKRGNTTLKITDSIYDGEYVIATFTYEEAVTAIYEN